MRVTQISSLLLLAVRGLLAAATRCRRLGATAAATTSGHLGLLVALLLVVIAIHIVVVLLIVNVAAAIGGLTGEVFDAKGRDLLADGRAPGSTTARPPRGPRPC
eukprot:404904_1